jgi:hypothetical protein
MADFLQVCAVMATSTALLQHVRGDLFYLGQSTAVFLPFFLNWNFLFDFLLDLLASLLDETLPVRQVLLNKCLVVVFGGHVLLDVVVVQILPSSHHRHVCLVMQCLQLWLAILKLLSSFSYLSILYFLQGLFILLAISLSTMRMGIDEMRIMVDSFRGVAMLSIGLEVHEPILTNPSALRNGIEVAADQTSDRPTDVYYLPHLAAIPCFVNGQAITGDRAVLAHQQVQVGVLPLHHNNINAGRMKSARKGYYEYGL